jgi:hypothetical protein
MGLLRPSLSELSDRIYQDHATRFHPLDKSPRYNLLRVMSQVDAGKYHQLYGDLNFLSRQIFPDTAEGEYLRAHWSDRVPPNHAVAATGRVRIPGTNGVPVPVGLLFSSTRGKVYYVEAVAAVVDGFALPIVTAQEPGSDSNLAEGEELAISSAVPPGLSSTATVAEGGISGGVNAESDAAYLNRVIQNIRNGVRYGKPGDFAAWAVDASAGVSKAFEIRNYGPLGALLIQVIAGNQVDGVTQVGNLSIVSDYLFSVAPPTVFTVKTPVLVPLDPSVHLLPVEDTVSNRILVEHRMRTYLDLTAKPGRSYTPGMLRDAIVDGVIITDASISIGLATRTTTALELFVLGVPSWA